MSTCVKLKRQYEYLQALKNTYKKRASYHAGLELGRFKWQRANLHATGPIS